MANTCPDRQGRCACIAYRVVTAADVNVGDSIVTSPSEHPHAVYPVTQISEYPLASPLSGEAIQTSNPPSHRWTVLHFQTSVMGLVRFPHEPVEVVRDPASNNGRSDG